MEIEFTIPIKPKSKGRPRATRAGGVYTDKATREYEKAIHQFYNESGFTKFEGNVELHCTFYKDHIVVNISDVNEESKLRGDLDNMVKSLLDGLNGVAYNDDKQVVNLLAFKR